MVKDWRVLCINSILRQQCFELLYLLGCRQHVVVMEDDGLPKMQGKEPYASVPNEAMVVESF
eukprot:scaffold107_cov269-Chaetoceros_neogracile.AAC.39